MGVNVTAPDLFGLRRLSALDGLRLSGGAFVVWCETAADQSYCAHTTKAPPRMRETPNE